jgi:WD40 repeat protein
MSACPDLGALEARTSTVRDHLAQCSSCRLVIDLLDERKRGVEARDRRSECARFEMLLAARDEGTIGPTAGALLEAHIRECSSCQAVAATLPPASERPDHSDLPAVPTSAYALGREVARGGMGRILAADDLRIGRPVAVKELLGKSSPSLAARFEREARVTARLQHPGIVPIYEIGKWPDGTPFYTMRMIEGRTLRDAIRDKPTLDDRLALLPAVIAAADAVAFAHGKRIIHRDLTPNNILVGEYGDTVVIDWGLAKDLTETGEDHAIAPYRDELGPASNLTSAGAVIGTAAYMPPEQATGAAVDGRADVYAMGAILYHLLAGVPPYRTGASDAVVQQVKAGPPTAISAVSPAAPRDLVSIVDKAMARDPNARYTTAAEVATELRRFQTGQLVGAHRYSLGQILRRWLTRNRRAVAVGVLALTALAAVGVISVGRISDERDTAEASNARSEQERHRADQLAVGLLEDRGRRELLDGNRERAAVYLSAAYSRGLDSPALRFMLADAMTTFDGEISRMSFAVASSANLDRGNFDHSGRRIVLVEDGKATEIFDVATGAHVAELEGTDHGASNLQFSPDDASLYGNLADTLMRWDAATGKLMASVAAHRGGMRLTSVYDSGRLIATAGHEDGVIKVWDARTLTLVAEQPRAHGGISELAVSPDDQHLLEVGFDSTATIRDAHTARLVRELHGTGRMIAAQHEHLFSADGKRLVLGDVGGTVTIWDVDSGTSLRAIPGHGAPVMAQFDSSGSRLLVVDFRRDAYIADAATGQTVTRFHLTGMASFARFSGDGTRVIAARITSPTTGSIDVLDAASGALLARREGRPLMWNESADRLAIGSGDQVRIVALTSGRLVRLLKQPTMTGGWFMIDSRHIMTQTDGPDGRRWIWSPDTTRREPLALAVTVLDTIADGSRQLVRTSVGAELQDASGTVLAKLAEIDAAHAQFTPDDRSLVVADGEGVIHVLDPSTGATVATITGHHAKLAALSCLRAGPCATVDAAGQVQTWTVEGVQLSSCRPSDGRAGFVSISPDGTRMVVAIATAAAADVSAATWQPVLFAVDGCREIASLGAPGKDRELKVDFRGSSVLVDHTVSDARDGHRLADIPPMSAEIKLLLAPDGRHVATMSWGSSGLWSVVRDYAPTEIEFDGPIYDGRFSTDGALFYAGNVEGAVDVVEVASGRVLARLPVPPPTLHLVEGQNDVNTQNFLVDASEAGDQLLTAGPDPAVRIWSVARETRSPGEIASLVAALSPWKLDGAALVRGTRGDR